MKPSLSIQRLLNSVETLLSLCASCFAVWNRRRKDSHAL